MCQGYYRHAEGYTPEWEGMADFKGRIVHPQTWPEDLDYRGKRVVVIGSGATAATLIPAIADDARTSPCCSARRPISAPAATPSRSPTSCAGCRWTRPGSTRSCAARSSTSRTVFTRRSFTEPEAVKKELLGARPRATARTRLRHRRRTSRRATGRGSSASPSFPTATCSRASPTGKASVVTDEIERFTEKGILLKSGKVLEADIIVTATGFNLSVLGDIEFDDRRQAARLLRHRHLSRHDVHRRAQHGLGVRLFPRQLDAARRPGRRLRLPAAQPHEGERRERVTPALRPEDADMPLLPWIDPENFNPGYMMRGMHLLPKRGDKPEWQHTQDYWAEKDEFPAIDLDDDAFVYE